jgi:hypothetical protein
MARYVVESGSPSYYNFGNATISIGDTYVDVTHGLPTTPTKVMITSTTNIGTRSLWVSDRGAATFRINIDSSDIIDHTFDWEAEV